jgi:hypothetical protein
MNWQKNPPKNPLLNDDFRKFNCDDCCFTSANKKDYERHLKTKKHEKMTKCIAKILPMNELPSYICKNCNKCYQDASGLWKHNKKCKIIEEREPSVISEQPTFSNDLLVTLINQNTELQKQIFELAKNQNVVNNMHMNSHNTTNNHFNLNLFLNETCKDALNITDFLQSIQLQVKDFEATGKLGYVEGISRIIINGLKTMDVHKRPIHCTDVKRETVYIKDNNFWEKENEEKMRLKKAVSHVAQMNLSQLRQWQKENPNHVNINTKENEDFLHLSMVALGGQSEKEDEKYMDQILKKVFKEIVIDKTI